jgi:hypothetical protein
MGAERNKNKFIQENFLYKNNFLEVVKTLRAK